MGGHLKIMTICIQELEEWRNLMVSMLMTPDQVVWVRAQPRAIVMCSWARHFTLTVCHSTQVYKWVHVPANLMLGVISAMDQHFIQGGVEILLVTSCY